MLLRILTAVVSMPVFLGLLYVGRWPLFAIVTGMGLVGFYEYARMWRAKQARLSHRVGSLSLRLCCPLPIAQLTCRRRQVSSARKSPPTVFLECSRIAFVACNFAVADWRCTMLFSLAVGFLARIGAHVQMRREDSAVVALQQSN